MEDSKTTFYQKHPYFARTAVAIGIGLVGLLGGAYSLQSQQASKEQAKPKVQVEEKQKKEMMPMPGMRGMRPGYMMQGQGMRGMRGQYMPGMGMGPGMHYGQRMRHMRMHMQRQMHRIEGNLERTLGREMMMRPYFGMQMRGLGQYMTPKIRELVQEQRKHAVEIIKKYEPNRKAFREEMNKLRKETREKVQAEIKHAREAAKIKK